VIKKNEMIIIIMMMMMMMITTYNNNDTTHKSLLSYKKLFGEYDHVGSTYMKKYLYTQDDSHPPGMLMARLYCFL